MYILLVEGIYYLFLKGALVALNMRPTSYLNTRKKISWFQRSACWSIRSQRKKTRSRYFDCFNTNNAASTKAQALWHNRIFDLLKCRK